jgi:hypothetical protein
MHVLQRRNELSADLYAVRLGYGLSLKSALIRSYAENLDTLFPSELDNFLFSSHPTLQKRLETVTEELKKNDYLEMAQENIKNLQKVVLDITLDEEEIVSNKNDEIEPDIE